MQLYIYICNGTRLQSFDHNAVLVLGVGPAFSELEQTPSTSTPASKLHVPSHIHNLVPTHFLYGYLEDLQLAIQQPAPVQ